MARTYYVKVAADNSVLDGLVFDEDQGMTIDVGGAVWWKVSGRPNLKGTFVAGPPAYVEPPPPVEDDEVEP